MCIRVGALYKWWQQWDEVNCRTVVALPTDSQDMFRNETSGRGKLRKACDALICKLVFLFIVFGEHGRYIGNINHLW